MQKLGQHFLKNASVLQDIAEAVGVQKGETIVEIGPGHGELTIPLASEAEKCNGRVISIERDRSLIATLGEMAEKEAPELLTIIEGDALKLLPDTTTKLGKYRIAGNIPYYITGKLLRVVGELEHRPERAVLLIQKEVAERICAAPPEMNRLAASVQFWAEPSITRLVSKNDFSPPPEVESAVIVLDVRTGAEKTREAVGAEQYYRAVRAIFAQPRKTLLNNLSAGAGDGVKKEAIVRALEKIGIKPDARPQDLDIERIIAIATAPLWG